LFVLSDPREQVIQVIAGELPVKGTRGQVVTDLAVMIADGGEAISDIAILGDQKQLLGPVATMPTAWSTLDEITPARLKKIASARAKTRRHVRTLIKTRHGRIHRPGSPVVTSARRS
jgi:hypothetical protein